MLRNLEDERMRMVGPCPPGAGRVAALRAVGGVAPWHAASPRARGRAEGEEGELGGGAHSRSISYGVLLLEKRQRLLVGLGGRGAGWVRAPQPRPALIQREPEG